MAEWLDFKLYLDSSGLFILILPLVCGLVYYIYLRTSPEVARARRLFLVFLRSAVVGLLLLILAEPVLELWRKQVVQPLLLLLVDTSASMATEEGGAQRLEQVKEVLAHEEWEKALAPAEVRVWGFAEEPYPMSLDTLAALKSSGKATDLSGALTKSINQVYEHGNLRGIVLFSDGIHNLGEDPLRAAETAGVPVYALAVGGRDNPADIQIVRADVAEIGYVGRALRVEAEVRAWGYAERAVEVLLYDGEARIDRQRLVLGGEGQVQRVSFTVRPAVAGPQVYRLFIPPEEGEFFRDNNETLVFTRVMEERIQALLVAGGPSPDLAFMQRALAADSNIVVEPWIQKKDGSFYQGTFDPGEKLAGDVVILLDAGEELLRGRMGQAVQGKIREGGGLLFVGGFRSFRGWMPDGPVAELLPVQMDRSAARFIGQEISLRLSPEGRHHPVVRLLEAAGRGDPWAQLPPLPGRFPAARVRRGGVVLVEGGSEERPPIIVAGAAGKGRVIAALSTSFWRLDLLTSGVGGRPQTIRDFWQNAVKWLAIQAPVGRLRVSTERHIYRSGEQIVFAAQVFDELLRPQGSARVQITLPRKGLDFQLQEQGGGRYQGHWSSLEPGEYSYEATAYAEGEQIGVDEGHFIVEQHSIESVDVRANPELLGEIVRVSSGRMRPLADWREMLNLLPLQKRLVEEEKVLPLWGRNEALVLLVCLLVIEWVIRKRSGMI